MVANKNDQTKKKNNPAREPHGTSEHLLWLPRAGKSTACGGREGGRDCGHAPCKKAIKVETRL